MVNQSNPTDFKLCPFCGGNAQEQQAFLGSKKHLVVWIKCTTCGVSTASYSDGTQARKSWNRRTYDKS